MSEIERQLRILKALEHNPDTTQARLTISWASPWAASTGTSSD